MLIRSGDQQKVIYRLWGLVLNVTWKLVSCKLYLSLILHKIEGAYLPTCYSCCVNLEITPDTLKAIAHQAMERKTGARGLRSIMVRYRHCKS